MEDLIDAIKIEHKLEEINEMPALQSRATLKVTQNFLGDAKDLDKAMQEAENKIIKFLHGASIDLLKKVRDFLINQGEMARANDIESHIRDLSKREVVKIQNSQRFEPGASVMSTTTLGNIKAGGTGKIINNWKFGVHRGYIIDWDDGFTAFQHEEFLALNECCNDCGCKGAVDVATDQ